MAVFLATILSSLPDQAGSLLFPYFLPPARMEEVSPFKLTLPLFTPASPRNFRPFSLPTSSFGRALSATLPGRAAGFD